MVYGDPEAPTTLTTSESDDQFSSTSEFNPEISTEENDSDELLSEFELLRSDSDQEKFTTPTRQRIFKGTYTPRGITPQKSRPASFSTPTKINRPSPFTPKFRRTLSTPTLPTRSTPRQRSTTALDQAKEQLHVAATPKALPCRG